MAKEEIIYQQSRVALVDQNQSNYDENQMIYGTISIVKSRNKYCFRYSPSNLRDSTSEDWAMVQEGSSSVSFKQNGTDSSLTFQSSTTNHRFQFDLNQIKTFQRQQYPPEKTLGQVTIQLKDGKYLPTMLFYLGGSKKLMNCIEHHSSLKTYNSKLHYCRLVDLLSSNRLSFVLGQRQIPVYFVWYKKLQRSAFLTKWIFLMIIQRHLIIG